MSQRRKKINKKTFADFQKNRGYTIIATAIICAFIFAGYHDNLPKWIYLEHAFLIINVYPEYTAVALSYLSYYGGLLGGFSLYGYYAKKTYDETQKHDKKRTIYAKIRRSKRKRKAKTN